MWLVYLGVLGMTGMTEHHGLEEFVRPKLVKKASLCAIITWDPHAHSSPGQCRIRPGRP